MVGIYEILRQDFEAARGAFVEADFHDMNICANRLMSNVLFGFENDTKYILPGFFLRIIANELLALRENAVAKVIRPHAERFVAEIDRAFKEEVDLTIIWNGFFEFIERKREFLVTPVERKVYKANRAFTAQGLAFLSRRFFNDPFLSSRDGIMLKALITEADRLIRHHGAENNELVLFALMRALDWLDRYVAVAFSDADKTGSLESLKEDLIPLLEEVRVWYASSEKLPYSRGTQILCNILLQWRKYFLRYMERAKTVADEERRVELPGQVKERIGKTIANALQKDLGEKGAKGKRR